MFLKRESKEKEVYFKIEERKMKLNKKGLLLETAIKLSIIGWFKGFKSLEEDEYKKKEERENYMKEEEIRENKIKNEYKEKLNLLEGSYKEVV